MSKQDRQDKQASLSLEENQARKAREQLQKQEQKALKRLQEAQLAQAKAWDRFERAQARLQKRTTRLERVVDRLLLIRQQLQEPASTPGETPDEIVETADVVIVTEANIRVAIERAASMSASQAVARAEEEEMMQEEDESGQATSSETFAHFTAERAAKARAIAEMSSAATREARLRVVQAETRLGQVRLSIRSGALQDEEAELALLLAERDVTYAQAALADAESAEEQDLQAAGEAELAAEIVEDVEGGDFAAADEADITMKVPLVRQQSQQGEETLE